MGCSESKNQTTTRGGAASKYPPPHGAAKAPPGKASPATSAPAKAAPALGPCKYYQSGNCRAGVTCRYQHVPRTSPPVAPAATAVKTAPAAMRTATTHSTKMCQYFMAGYCRNGSSCPDSHGSGGTLGPSISTGTSGNLCQYFISGYCREGAACKDLHPAGLLADDHAAPAAVPQTRARGIDDDEAMRLAIEQSWREEEERQIKQAEEASKRGEKPRPMPKKPRGDGKQDPMDVFPVFPYHQTASDRTKPADDPSLSCPICMCAYEEGEDIMMLTCMHRFHASCAADWVRKHPTCPNCNMDITVTGSQLFLSE